MRTDAYGQTIGLYPATGSDLAVRFRGLIDLAPTTDRDVAGPGADPLYAMGARPYSPHLGTFTALDSYAGEAVNPASLNRYLYAHANPATLIDPTGHAPLIGDTPDTAYLPIHKPKPTSPSTGGTSSGTNTGTNTGGTSGGNTNAGGSTPPPVRDDWARMPGLDDYWFGQSMYWADQTARCTGIWTAQAAASCAGANDVLGGILEGAWNGTIGGVIALGQHIGGNLDKIPVGLGVLVSHPGESIGAIGQASGLGDPVSNLGRGWDAMLRMSPHDKASFWSSIVTGAVIGPKVPTKVPGRGNVPKTPAALRSGSELVDLMNTKPRLSARIASDPSEIGYLDALDIAGTTSKGVDGNWDVLIHQTTLAAIRRFMSTFTMSSRSATLGTLANPRGSTCTSTTSFQGWAGHSERTNE